MTKKIEIEHLMSVKDFINKDGILKKNRKIYSYSGIVCFGTYVSKNGKSILVLNESTGNDVLLPESNCYVKIKAIAVIE